MKINILSPGRFHVLDLARELDKNGFDVKFYSFVPTKGRFPLGCLRIVRLPFSPYVAIPCPAEGFPWAAVGSAVAHVGARQDDGLADAQV